MKNQWLNDRPFGSSRQWPGAGNENVDNVFWTTQSLALSTKCANFMSKVCSKSWSKIQLAMILQLNFKEWTARINKFDLCLHLRLLCLGLELGLGLEASLQKKWGRGLANQAPAPTAAHPHLLGWWFLKGSGRKNNFQLYSFYGLSGRHSRAHWHDRRHQKSFRHRAVMIGTGKWTGEDRWLEPKIVSGQFVRCQLQNMR